MADEKIKDEHGHLDMDAVAKGLGAERGARVESRGGYFGAMSTAAQVAALPRGGETSEEKPPLAPFVPLNIADAERAFADDDATRFVDLISPRDFDAAARLLRAFFRDEMGFIESSPQHRMRAPLGNMAACENPGSIMPVLFRGKKVPLPQTGQMWLEYDLLKDPTLPGLFCQTTSYRNEQDPQVGRHNLVFPMFEFETHGDIDRLRDLLRALIRFLGIVPPGEEILEVDYESAARWLGVKEIGDNEEKIICEKYGPVILLSRFPEYTNPFPNMRRGADGKSEKIDVLMPIETIGSAERSCDPHDIWLRFHTVTNGEYAQALFEWFGEKEILAELRYYLSLPLFPRCGGGIGMTRLIRTLKLAGKI